MCPSSSTNNVFISIHKASKATKKTEPENERAAVALSGGPQTAASVGARTAVIRLTLCSCHAVCVLWLLGHLQPLHWAPSGEGWVLASMYKLRPSLKSRVPNGGAKAREAGPVVPPMSQSWNTASWPTITDTVTTQNRDLETTGTVLVSMSHLCWIASGFLVRCGPRYVAAGASTSGTRGTSGNCVLSISKRPPPFS